MPPKPRDEANATSAPAQAAAQPTASDAPAEPPAQKFTVDELAERAVQAFGCSPHAVRGALHGQRELTVAQAKQKISAWLEAPVVP